LNTTPALAVVALANIGPPESPWQVSLSVLTAATISGGT
jgi:hypothetical protein